MSYNRRRGVRPHHVLGGIASIIILAVVFGGHLLKSTVEATVDNHWETCTVTNMTAGTTSQGTSHYRIYTEQCGVLADGDQWLTGKHNSADIYGQIQVGHTYNFHVVGIRNDTLSEFPNVLAVTPVTAPAPAASSRAPGR